MGAWGTVVVVGRVVLSQLLLMLLSREELAHDGLGKGRSFGDG